ncbi:MAG TPA: hypothetical protein VKW06_04390 [Candidatus Angelobacter sp.]|nr:hypothetical protein [Candidatus Angelobacter sp.]
MFVGHYGPSFAAKALDKDQRVPLWILFLAVQFVDVLWAIFVLLGVEKVRIVPGITASSPLDLYYMPYTHSLIGALGWSALAFVACQLIPRLRGPRSGWLVGGAVFSHWILDLIVHRPDLPLYDNVFKMGFGLWNYQVPSFLLEMAVLFGGAGLYLNTVTRKGRVMVFVFAMAALQFVGTFLFPPPPSDRGAAMMALLMYFLLAALAAWVGHQKRATPQPAATSSANMN